jgi:tRNA/rRNA methyltransferase
MARLTASFERVRVVLVEPTYDGNLGQVARAMRNFGLSRLVLVGGTADPDADEARWYARAEGQQVLDGVVRHATLAEAVADCRTVIGTSRRQGGTRGYGQDPEPVFRETAPWAVAWETALVFGREANGLHTAELDLCQHFVAIPTDDDCPSLNLAHAVCITGYALSQAARQAQRIVEREDEPPADHDLLEAMYAQARRVWVRIGYLHTPNPDTMLRRWRRIFGRARLTASDVAVVRSMLHQTDWAAEIAEIPQGGAKEAPPGFFDKHKVHLQPAPDERSPNEGGRRGKV